MTGEAQGSDDSIKSFLKELNTGPSAAHVVKVEKEEIETKVCTFQSDSFLIATGTGSLDMVWRKKALFPSQLSSGTRILL